MTYYARYKGSPTRMPTKDPDAVIQYGFDWTDYLGDESILTSEWLPDSEDLVVESSSAADGKTTSVLLSGGQNGRRYKVTNRITFSRDGETMTDDRTMIIPVQEM